MELVRIQCSEMSSAAIPSCKVVPKFFALKTLILILWKRQDVNQWFQCFTEDKLSHYCHYLIISYAEKYQLQIHLWVRTSNIISYNVSLSRFYLQVMLWLSKINDMDPTNLGWFLKDGKLFSVMMDISPAPERLFKMVRCNCSDDATQWHAVVKNLDSSEPELLENVKLKTVKIQLESWFQMKKTLKTLCKIYILKSP